MVTHIIPAQEVGAGEIPGEPEIHETQTPKNNNKNLLLADLVTTGLQL